MSYTLVTVADHHVTLRFQTAEEAFARGGEITARLVGDKKTGLHLPPNMDVEGSIAFFYHYNGGQALAEKLSRAIVFITRN